MTSGEVGISLSTGGLAFVTDELDGDQHYYHREPRQGNPLPHPALFLGRHIDPTIGNSSIAVSSGVPEGASGITRVTAERRNNGFVLFKHLRQLCFEPLR